MLALASCGGKRDESAIAAEVRVGLSTALGSPVKKVTCKPPNADGQACIATIAAGCELAVAVTADANGAKRWELQQDVVATAPLKQFLTESLGDLGVVETVDCGPPFAIAAVGDVVPCSVGDHGMAWARILPDDDFELELALDQTAVLARTANLSQAEVDTAAQALVESEPGEDDSDDEPLSPAGRLDAAQGQLVDAGIN